MLRVEPSKLARRAIYGAIAFERFAWYALLAGFVLSLTESGHTQAEAAKQYGLLLMAAYLAPLAGVYLGGVYSLRGAVAVGLGLLFTAYALGANGSHSAMLICAAAGCGMFKPCLATLLTSLYPTNDPKKAKAVQVYYLWIQLGSIPSAGVAGLVRVHFGWSAVYAVCASAVLLAALCVLVAWPKLKPFDSNLETFIGTALQPGSANDTPEPWKYGAIFTLIIGGALFFAANQQQGSTLTFWAQSQINRVTQWGEIPAESFGTLNPVFCALLTPVIVLWSASVRTRLVSAMIAVAASFIVLLLPVGHNIAGLVIAYLLGAVGELLISPGGMSAVTDLVPRKYAALGMAIWLLTMSIGGYLAGVFGGLHMETAAIATAAMSLAGACWYALRWPKKDPEPEAVSAVAEVVA